MSETNSKKRVVILGGGISALTAAYYLSDTQELREKYDVTVYQMGWRLGGKCASGRNAQAAHRIEEHGVHVFSGFYANAFAMLRDCYESLDRPLETPLSTCIGAPIRRSSRIIGSALWKPSTNVGIVGTCLSTPTLPNCRATV